MQISRYIIDTKNHFSQDELTGIIQKADFYFKSRSTNTWLAVRGQALCIPATQDALKNFWQVADEDTKLYGALPFEWPRSETFFFLPEEEWVFDGTQLTHASYTAEKTPKSWQRSLNTSLFIPTLEQNLLWTERFDKALRSIRSKTLTKIVLAHCSAEQSSINNLKDLFLQQKESNPDAFHVFWRTPDFEFLSFSPERLFQRTGIRIDTEAIAGTCSRSQDEAHNNLLKESLLHDDKLMREHGIVNQHIETQLASLCIDSGQVQNTHVVSCKKLMHLKTPFAGLMREDKNDLDALLALHPSPALAGYPVTAARQWLYEHEGFRRGIFGGVIGYISKTQSEMAVCIRAILHTSNTLYRFAGAGLVEGSDCEEEWLEIQYKLDSLGL